MGRRVRTIGDLGELVSEIIRVNRKCPTGFAPHLGKQLAPAV